jgi:5'(3')-deoxyribonucleotidase
MKFGFDVDDTLINLREHAFYLYNQKLKKNVPIEVFHSLTTLEIHKPFGLSDKEGSAMWKSFMEEIYFSDCPPFPYAVEVLNELIKDGHEVYYITSRPAVHCTKTKDWLLNAGFPVKEGSFFCGMKDSEKIQIIQDLGLDYYFDDKPAVLETLNDTVISVVKKINSYNQHVKLQGIECWSDLKNMIKHQ